MLAQQAFSQNASKKIVMIDPAPFADNAHHWYDLFDKGNIINPLPGRPKYPPTAIKEIADNILLFQKDNGGWPKNYDVFAILSDAQKDSVKASKAKTNTTFDNDCTHTHIAALCVAYTATSNDEYKKGALKGLDFIVKSQYSNGGWPQYYPLENNYSRHITYNDGVFKGIMVLLKDIIDKKPQYAFIGEVELKKLSKAYEKGLDCIIKTQINDIGKPTAWCQQYDEETLQPAWARKFEPASICNKESADLVFFLMSISSPSKEIKNAIENAVAWFEASKIHNTKVVTVSAPDTVTTFRVSKTDKIVINDVTAPPIWTRYYELKTHRPMFCNRDSKVVYSLAEVERERRDGYAWYTYDPQKVLDQYPIWKNKWN
ncbi:MAG: pectate lyase [Pelobium sp.]